MTEFQIEKLTSLGMNIDETMERFINNEGLFFRCIKKFSDDLSYQKMMDAINSNNSKEAFEASHALKGVASNLGLDNLYKGVQPLVEVFRAGSMDYNPEELKKVEQYYNEALEVINELT